mmetsp:Transcript_76749/g.152143  ORF Transcript_76749/g.152143 Transcript_76749/m.152143 type:complete len:771 (-) Transcript_76749:1490-3802(-)
MFFLSLFLLPPQKTRVRVPAWKGVSFENTLNKWKAELSHHAPGVPLLLVGTKADLRNDPSSQSSLRAGSMVSTAEAEAAARNMGAEAYVETSALTQEGVLACFHQAVRVAQSSTAATKKHASAGLPRSFVGQRRRPPQAASPAPVMPPAGKAPYTNVLTARFGEPLRALIGSYEDADLELVLEGHTIPAHRVILCAASPWWQACLIGGARPPIVTSISPPGADGTLARIELSPVLSYNTLLHCLEFWYVGMVELLVGHPLLAAAAHEETAALGAAAKLFEAAPLLEAVDHARSGRGEMLNPSIGTHSSDAAGARLVELFLGRELFSDLSIVLSDGRCIPAHRAILRARSLAVRGAIAQGSGGTLSILAEAQPEVALATLEYLYSEHAPVEELGENRLELLEQAAHVGDKRLVSLCELNLSKVVDRDVEASITKARVDIVRLLLRAQAAHAHQLSAFLLHLISTNYVPMRRRAEWPLLTGENLEHVEAHRWPPVSYLTAAAAWEATQAKQRRRTEQPRCPGILKLLSCWSAIPSPSGLSADLAKTTAGNLDEDWGGEPATETSSTAIEMVASTLNSEWVAKLEALEKAGKQAVPLRAKCVPTVAPTLAAVLPIASTAATPTPPVVTTALPMEKGAEPTGGEVVVGQKLSAGTEECIAICIDRSGSMGAPFSTDRSRMEAVKQMFYAFRDRVESLGVQGGHQLGLVQFDNSVDVLLQLSSDLAAFENSVDDMKQVSSLGVCNGQPLLLTRPCLVLESCGKGGGTSVISRVEG